MSVRTETFGHQAPRIPLVSIVAGILAFAIGITLGATVLDREGDTRVSAPGAVVEAPPVDWDRGALQAAELRAQGYRGFVYTPRDFLQVAEGTAGVTEPVLRGPNAGLPKRPGTRIETGGPTPLQMQILRNQAHQA